MMASDTFIPRFFAIAMVMLVSLAGQPSASSSQESAPGGVIRTAAGRNEQGGAWKASFSPEQIDAIAAALPAGEARDTFLKGVAAAETGGASDERGLRAGEGASQYFHKGVAAVSAAKEKIASFFRDSPGRAAGWRAAFENINQGRGPGHLALTGLAAVLLILAGLFAEKLVKRYTRGLRRQVLERARLGRLHFLERIVSKLFLNLLGFGAYLISTFLLCALIYKETDPGYMLVSVILLPSYYIRFLAMAADFGLSPSAPALRIFPMQDEDAKFLYRWIMRLAIAGIVIASAAYLVDDAFRVGDYIETAGTKGMVEHISLRSLRLRHPRGPVYTIPFGGMGNVKNNSRDYIITKLDFRVRYDTDVNKVRKIIKKINIKLQKDPEMGPVLLDKVKSQGVRELDDSAMIMRVKFKTVPGEQFVVRREVFRLMQEAFRKNGIEFAHRNVTVYLPPETSEATGESLPGQDSGKKAPADQKAIETAGAAAGLATIQAEGEEKSGEEKK